MPLGTSRRDHGEVMMATKTVVCPECGSETALGRYTCVECGAFLDGIAVQRAPDRVPLADRADEPPVDLREFGPDEDGEDDEADAVAATDPIDAFDAATAQPDDRSTGVQWPPTGALPALPVPEPRLPAGSWLPPSAHLTGLEEPEPGGVAAAAVLPSAATRGLPRDWLAAFGSGEARWAAARRIIAIGSVVGLFGFVLPWAGGSFGNLLNVWLSVWGLAFGGTWLIALGLVAMTAVAALSGRVESIALGVPALTLAALQLGLIWSALFGAGSRPIGILVVLVGAIVLGVGGAIQLGARHEAATPDV
jgi:hypothetical protein